MFLHPYGAAPPANTPLRGRVALLMQKTIKAIVVRQPFAGQIASGSKSIELRSRRTHHRGDLLIVAGPHVPDDPAHRDLPRRCALAIVNLTDCRPMRPEDAQAAG